jgi:flagellar motility protein MotE (MotC chaperone)
MAALKGMDTKTAQTVKEIEQAMLGPKRQDPVQDTEEEIKERKPMGKPMVALLVSLAWMTVLGIFILFVLGEPPVVESSKPVRAWLMQRLDPESEIREHIHMSEILEYQDAQRELEADWDEVMEDLAERELELDEFELELEERAFELDELQAALEEMRDRLSESGIIGPDVIHAAKTLERMEPAAAAEAMQEMLSTEAVVRISLVMNTKRLGPIFSAMEPGFAAAILEQMSDEDDSWDDFWDDLDSDW